jgi:hypothetical protein
MRRRNFKQGVILISLENNRVRLKARLYFDLYLKRLYHRAFSLMARVDKGLTAYPCSQGSSREARYYQYRASTRPPAYCGRLAETDPASLRILLLGGLRVWNSVRERHAGSFEQDP